VKAFPGIPLRERNFFRTAPCIVRTVPRSTRFFSSSRMGYPRNAFTCLHLSETLNDFMQLQVKARKKNAFTCLHRETMK